MDPTGRSHSAPKWILSHLFALAMVALCISRWCGSSTVAISGRTATS